ncbi:glutamate receptor ionotropic, kainate 4-like [Amphibalanus amphitrite]|uniref:glutamate receptor ionotropic, kainate 4-like n=1 Tax=Amphibalanus amphitrite TaxID=1232801 RepID=UPI001C8FC856|nr:glutamate receptor ionotropic, kainate 4-like [Amphibalanus amphitrite]
MNSSLLTPESPPSFDISRSSPISDELRLAALHDPPYLFINQRADRGLRYDGLLWDLWQLLAEGLQLRYRIIPLWDGGYGHRSANGTWSGLAAELVYNRADVGLSWIAHSPERDKVIDYVDTVPIDISEETFLVRQGPEEELRLDVKVMLSLLEPLKPQVWWTLVASLLVIAMVLRLTLRYEEREFGNNFRTGWGGRKMENSRTSSKSREKDGWEHSPNRLSPRLVSLSAWLLGIIIYTSYTANLTSHLAASHPGLPLESLDDFAKQSDWKFACEPGQLQIGVWAASHDPVERELSRRYEQRDRLLVANLSGPEEQLTALLRPKVMLYIDARKLRRWLGQRSCSLVPLPRAPPSVPLKGYLTVSKKLPALKKALNEEMLRLASTGVLQRLKNQWLSVQKSMCKRQPAFRQVTLGNLMGVVALVPLAIAVSLVLLGLELVWSVTINHAFVSMWG